jgi:hypothetical protein
VVSRRAGLALSLAVVAVYVGLAAWSGALSPLTRGPLLDGLGPLQAYRWVSPPPELASTNVAASSLTTTLPLLPQGNRGASLVSSDSQITVVIPNGAIASNAGDTGVRIDLTPGDPAAVAPLGDGLEVFGNTYLIEATYLPSGTPAKALAAKIDVILVYPVTAALHSPSHELLTSRTGDGWKPLQSNDVISAQQVEAQSSELGYVVVGGVVSPLPVTNSPGGSGGGAGNAVAIGLFAVAGVALLVGIGLVLRGRNR